MKKFEYEITPHSAAEFRHVAFFCSQEGACNLEEVPDDQLRRLTERLNERGASGWELVQVSFGKHGLLAFWKREVKGA